MGNPNLKGIYSTYVTNASYANIIRSIRSIFVYAPKYNVIRYKEDYESYLLIRHIDIELNYL